MTSYFDGSGQNVAAGDSYAVQQTADYIKSLNARIDQLEATLKRVAVIAHMGGLAQLTESEALTRIRRASLPFFDKSGTLADHGQRLVAALKETAS